MSKGVGNVLQKDLYDADESGSDYSHLEIRPSLKILRYEIPVLDVREQRKQRAIKEKAREIDSIKSAPVILTKLEDKEVKIKYRTRSNNTSSNKGIHSAATKSGSSSPRPNSSRPRPTSTWPYMCEINWPKPKHDFKLKGFLGSGKGKEFPELEMGSRYNYVIPEFELEDLDNLPWMQDPTVSPDDIKPNVLSVVASVSLGETLDLEMISKLGTNLSYNSNAFTPLVMRGTEPLATSMIFKTGKMIVTGTQSVEDCRLALKKSVATIAAMGYLVKPFGFKIQNITASCNVGFRIRVAALGREKLMGASTTYDPEIFNGVSISLKCPRSKIIIFRTGSILFTGVQSEEDLAILFKIAYPLIHAYAI